MKVQQNLLKICQQNLSKVCLKRDSSSWGNLSLGTVKDPQPWEKLKIGVIGAPLKIGQVQFGSLFCNLLTRATLKVRKSFDVISFLIQRNKPRDGATIKDLPPNNAKSNLVYL